MTAPLPTECGTTSTRYFEACFPRCLLKYFLMIFGFPIDAAPPGVHEYPACLGLERVDCCASPRRAIWVNGHDTVENFAVLPTRMMTGKHTRLPRKQIRGLYNGEAAASLGPLRGQCFPRFVRWDGTNARQRDLCRSSAETPVR